MEIILRYLKIIIKYRKVIFYNVLILTLLAAIISFILPKQYKATAQILPPTEEPDLLGFSSIISSSLSSSNLSRLARAGGLFRSASSSDLVAAIIQSRTIGEQVIYENDFMKEYKIKKSLEKALKLLKQLTSVKITEEGIIQVGVKAKNPILAANIVNSYIRNTDKFLKESNMSRGRNMRIFIEKRLETAEQELKEASDSLRKFQERNKIVALDEETKAVIDAYATLKSELLKREIELAVYQNISTSDNPYLLSIQREIDEFKKQLAKIEKARDQKTEGFGVGFAVSFRNLPAIAQEYARRFGDYKVKAEIFNLLLQQYEQAKILEARDTPTITVLDYAKIPEKKVFPKRLIIIISVFILSIIFTSLGCFINEYVKTIEKEKPDLFQEWRSTISTLKFKKK